MLRMRLLLPILLGFALAIGACGDEEEEQAAQQPTTAAFELTGSGKNAKMTGPSSVTAGVVQVDFRNSSDDNAGATLIRIEGGHTAAEAVKAGQAWGDQGKPLPDWVRFVGGSSGIDRGETDSAVQVLEAGSYAAVDINTNAYVGFEARGEGTGELPATTGKIEAKDYSFTTTRLKAGESRVLFTNAGKEPHFALAAPIRPGKTIADVRKAVKEEEGGGGEDPIVEKDAVSTGILDGGESQVIDLTLKKGSYALMCFVPDRKGGPPHAFLGMVSEGVVE
jgi:hypothetical protein